MKKPTLWLLIMVFLLPGTALPAGSDHTYSTWDNMELDRIASLWLIKRFVDPSATFRFYPRGTVEMEGTAIDTPTSRFIRTQSAGAYEILLRAHTLKEPSLVFIGQVVHDVEINIWGPKILPESQGINLLVKGIILGSTTPMECLDKGFVLMDALYAVLKDGK
jgi:hypothetical protein